MLARGRGGAPLFSQRPSQLIGASPVAEPLNGLAADRRYRLLPDLWPGARRRSAAGSRSPPASLR